jgi:hypothetical protein
LAWNSYLFLSLKILLVIFQGTNVYLDRMKVMNLARWKNYHGRWDVLISKCTKCFEEVKEGFTQIRSTTLITSFPSNKFEYYIPLHSPFQ